MGFRSSDVPDEQLIPAGSRARVRVETADEVLTQKGDPMLKVRVRLLDGEYSGASIFDQALLDHKESATAARLGQLRVREISMAVGVPNWDQARELVGKVCDAEIGIEPARGGYPAKNVIARYLPVGGDVPDFGSYGPSVPHPADDQVPF